MLNLDYMFSSPGVGFSNYMHFKYYVTIIYFFHFYGWFCTLCC